MMELELVNKKVDANIVKSAKANSITLASIMIEQFKFDGKYLVYSQDQRMVYFYNEVLGYYEPFEEFDLDSFIHKFVIENGVTDIWHMNRLTEIKKAIACNAAIPRVKFDVYDNLINFRNCVLDIENMKTIQHSKDLYFSYCVDVDFNPLADSPKKFCEFLDSTFRKRDGTVDRDTTDNIIKIMGYLIHPNNKSIKVPRMFLFLGEGANGKSLLMDTMKIFFDSKFISYLTLEEMSSHSFERTKLVGSRINMSTEAKESGVDAEEIKKIISGEGITINPKFKEPFSYFPCTKIVIASNTRPYFKDASHGIMRRLYIVDFPNRFCPEDKYAEYKDPASKGYYRAGDYVKMLSEFRAEASGILNFILDGLLTLKAQNWLLSESESSKKITQEYTHTNDQLGSWLAETFEVDTDVNNLSYITSKEILHMYREWYAENVSSRSLNLSVMTINNKIKEVFRLEIERVYDNGKVVRAWKLVLRNDD